MSQYRQGSECLSLSEVCLEKTKDVHATKCQSQNNSLFVKLTHPIGLSLHKSSGLNFAIFAT